MRSDDLIRTLSAYYVLKVFLYTVLVTPHDFVGEGTKALFIKPYYRSSAGLLHLGTVGILGGLTLCWGGGAAVLCMVGCFAAAPASIHELSVALQSHDNEKFLPTLPNISWGAQLSPVGITSLRIRQDSKTLKIGGQRQWECRVWSSNAVQAEWRPDGTMEGGYGRSLEALAFAHLGV